MEKRGQIALYVIIAILLVGAIAIVVFTQREAMKLQPAAQKAEIAPITSFVEDCIKSTGEDALIYVGQRSGYSVLPKNSIDSYAYYFMDNKSYFPSKETIEQQISLYMNDMLPYCTKNFESFPDFEISADPKAIETTTAILPTAVRFDVKWSVPIKKGEITYNANEFSVDIPSRLSTIYSVMQNITNEQMQDFSSICFSCIINLAIENDVYINMDNYDNITVIFTITDKNQQIKDRPYEFTFLNKY